MLQVQAEGPPRQRLLLEPTVKRHRPDVKVNQASEGPNNNKRSHQFTQSQEPSYQSKDLTKRNGVEQLEELVIYSLNSSVMVLQATLKGHPAKSLLDSGASGNFVTSQFISKFNIPTSPVQPKAVRLADGKLLQVDRMVSNVPVTLNQKTVNCDFLVLSELNNGHDCILGIPWLERADPIIDFKNRTIEWKG